MAWDTSIKRFYWYSVDDDYVAGFIFIFINEMKKFISITHLKIIDF